MLTGIACFIGGIFFAAAFPAPSAMIRERVAAGIAYVQDKVWPK